MIDKPFRIAVLGAGMRGLLLARIVRDYGYQAQITAIAEPRESYRTAFAAEFEIAPEMCFESWQDFAEKRRDVDAVMVMTMDRDHVGPALACLEYGYHLFLEKPVAPTLDECRKIEDAARDSRAITAVCHSLRYQKGFRKLKEVVDEGRIGKIVTLDHVEQVAWWHQAHSYVRGNWRREEEAAFMLLAKSCHDLDFISYLVDRPCLEIASFGELSYFRPENAPVGAGLRCTDCRIEAACPYSAIKFYLQTDRTKNPAAVISSDHSYEGHLQALRQGPYGRCVWHSDNNVVDHQVVLMQFDEGITATFTMTAFSQEIGRRLRVHGTQGDLFFDQKTITVRTFGDNNKEVIHLGDEQGAHGGGDIRVVKSWLSALVHNNPDLVLTSLQESLRTHTIVFAAERARLERRIVRLSEMARDLPNAMPARLAAIPGDLSNTKTPHNL